MKRTNLNPEEVYALLLFRKATPDLQDFLLDLAKALRQSQEGYDDSPRKETEKPE